MNRFLQLGVNKEGRDFCIGDIHGKYDQLMEAIDEVDFDKSKDRLIAVGDLIDRGQGNMEVLDLIWEPWFFTVVGNHEVMMADAVDDNASNRDILMWTQNGGHWWHALDWDDQQKLRTVYKPMVDETLPLAIEFMAPNGMRIGVAHGDLPGQWPWWEVRKYFQAAPDGYDYIAQHLLWSRTKINDVNFDKEVHGIDLVVHGHTPTQTPVWRGNAVFLDLGYYNKLKLFNVEDLLDDYDRRRAEKAARKLEEEEAGAEPDSGD